MRWLSASALVFLAATAAHGQETPIGSMARSKAGWRLRSVSRWAKRHDTAAVELQAGASIRF